MDINEISYAIRGSIYDAYNKLGPGLFESVYEHVLTHELVKKGIKVRRQVPLPVVYDNVRLDLGFRIDLLVNETVIVEVKSVEDLTPVHHKQVLTYLKLSGKKLGLLVNFNTVDISKSIFRKII